MIKTIQRKILVCAKNRCQKCLPSCEIVPVGCAFRILHPLDTSQSSGVQKRDRRSGKSGDLVTIANSLVDNGYSVYYVTQTENMVKLTKERFNPDKRVMFFGFTQAEKHLRGMRPGIILADDIDEGHANYLKDAVIGSKGHLFLAHYWTP